MEHHHLIADRDELDRFAELFIPVPFPSGYLGVVVLVSRTKYGANQTQQLNRHTFSSREEFIRSVLTLEVPLAAYTDSSSGRPVPSSAVVIYCWLHPRNMWHAFVQLSHTLLQTCNRVHQNLCELATDCIHHASRLGQLYWELDVDAKPATLLWEFLRSHPDISTLLVAVIETRGGYHVVFHHLSDREKRTLHEFCTQHEQWITLIRDPAPPVPGTLQGGFGVKFIDWTTCV